MEDRKLTPEQIESWRNVLVGMLGPYAFLMTDEQIYQFKEAFQARLVGELLVNEVRRVLDKGTRTILNAPVPEYVPPAKRKDMSAPTFMREQPYDPTRKTAMELALEKANLKK